MTPENITEDLLSAKKKGKDALKSFVEDRLISNNRKDFFDTLPNLKLGTFRDVQKKTSLSKEGKPSF